jgi:hypothetical protein
MNSNRKKHFSLGAIAGYEVGKTRIGFYVPGEEVQLCAEFADPINNNVEISGTRAAGYLFGYKCGVDAGTLPDAILNNLD